MTSSETHQKMTFDEAIEQNSIHEYSEIFLFVSKITTKNAIIFTIIGQTKTEVYLTPFVHG